MSTFTDDLSADLSNQFGQWSLAYLSSKNELTTAQEPSTVLPSVLASRAPRSLSELTAHVQELEKLEPGMAKDEVTLLASYFAMHAYSLSISHLMRQARYISQQDDYWRAVQEKPFQTVMWFVESLPLRLALLTKEIVTRLFHFLGDSVAPMQTNQGFLSTALATPRHIWVNFFDTLPPSILVTSMFPHLQENEQSSRKKTTLSTSAVRGSFLHAPFDMLLKNTRRFVSMAPKLSPYYLTQQEIQYKRSALISLREATAFKIGTLALSASTVIGEDAPPSAAEESVARLYSAGANALSLLRTAFGSLDADSSGRNSGEVSGPSTPAVNSSGVSETYPSMTDITLADISQLLNHQIPSQERLLQERLDSGLGIPGALTRAWPYAVAVPLGAYIVGSTVYKSRQSISDFLVQASETIQGFITDWVIQPVKDILDTVRLGPDNKMLIMGKESLASDLSSLERMVVEFGRDEYHLSEAELAQLAAQVRNGNITSVLKAWEADIKSPVKSAIRGSLLRTLLIQVQKVKVDVAMAMDGIEKMLQSQQLTFAFVGVAPSMIVLVGAVRWISNTVTPSRAAAAANQRDLRNRNWSTMRRLDNLVYLLNTLPVTPVTEGDRVKIHGLILIELDSLRSYAFSSNFPSKDTQLRESFVEDIRLVEQKVVGTNDVGSVEKEHLIERLWRWAQGFGWATIV